VEIIARGCLLHGSSVLLCRNLKHGYAYLPGGHVEFGESAAGALAREFLEECGVRVRVGELALVSEGAFPTKKRWHHEVNLVFHVEHATGWPDVKSRGAAAAHPIVKSREASIAFEWVELAAIPDMDLRPVSAKAWLATLGSTAGERVEWVSEIAGGSGPRFA
jgi:8-oxo-dGTP diphosphatase